ncbi:MAG TPA: DUF2935 domain-containing protein [Caproiciproducens sp.]|nr:DUF2935 domain-containing protein [Caproiciproducens sp.]
MLSTEEYIRKSIEYNLFWARIMKEHAIFIESSMPSSQMHLATQADQFKQQFETLLSDTIRLANGVLPKEVLLSGQYYTRFTEAAEQLVQKFTGIEINRNLTRMEYDIVPSGPGVPIGGQKEQEVSALNVRLLNQTKALVKFKSDLLNSQASCQIFTFLYSADLEHIMREGMRYTEILTGLQSKEDLAGQNYMGFWNQNMLEHAKSMRGLFDPKEDNYFSVADSFVKLYVALISSGTAMANDDLTNARNLSFFKANTTQGLMECKVKSLMSPLYTDHLLREANHYIYLLTH